MTDTTVREDITTQLDALFTAAGVRGYLHARDLESGIEVALDPDAPVVAASTFKVPVLVELLRQADAGLIDLTSQVTVPAEGRAAGPTGISAFSDAVTLS